MTQELNQAYKLASKAEGVTRLSLPSTRVSQLSTFSNWEVKLENTSENGISYWYGSIGFLGTVLVRASGKDYASMVHNLREQLTLLRDLKHVFSFVTSLDSPYNPE